MAVIIGNPGRYVQGSGEIKNLYRYAKTLGSKMLVIISDSGQKRLCDNPNYSAAEKLCNEVFSIFGGECSRKEIQKHVNKYTEKHCDLVVGVGGGKGLDTAKAVAQTVGVPVILVPTSASTDAPCSALSVIYTDDGEFSSNMFHPRNPDIVLVDSQIISKAPVRLFAAGMGDALSTFFEARACKASGASNGYGGGISQNTMMQAKLCFDIIMADGIKAYRSVQNGVLTKAVENIIEANIYLSGIGAEGAGDACAHGFYDALTGLPEVKPYYHGEIVAYGLFVQLILENESMDLINQILELYIKIGLPCTLNQIGISRNDGEKLRRVAEIACEDTLKNMPFPVTPEDVHAAIILADSLGKEFLQNYEGFLMKH